MRELANGIARVGRQHVQEHLLAARLVAGVARELGPLQGDDVIELGAHALQWSREVELLAELAPRLPEPLQQRVETREVIGQAAALEVPERRIAPEAGEEVVGELVEDPPEVEVLPERVLAAVPAGKFRSHAGPSTNDQLPGTSPPTLLTRLVRCKPSRQNSSALASAMGLSLRSRQWASL